MGLDIYFYKRKKDNQKPIAKALDEFGNDIEEVAYMRKHNYIYKYFEDKIGEDFLAKVDNGDLADLIDRCQQVLDACDEKVSAELLPTTSGFFFGSTEYSPMYYMYIAEDLDAYKKMLEEFNPAEEEIFVYFSY